MERSTSYPASSGADAPTWASRAAPKPAISRHINREQQCQRHLPCTRHIAQDAEEDRPTRGEQVTDRLGHTRERSGVSWVWRSKRRT